MNHQIANRPNASKRQKALSRHVPIHSQQYDISMITLTRRHIKSIHSDRGGLTAAALNHLGVPYPVRPKKGWLNDLIGTQVTEDQLKKAIAHRNTLKGGKTSDPLPSIEELVARIETLEGEVIRLRERMPLPERAEKAAMPQKRPETVK